MQVAACPLFQHYPGAMAVRLAAVCRTGTDSSWASDAVSQALFQQPIRGTPITINGWSGLESLRLSRIQLPQIPGLSRFSSPKEAVQIDSPGGVTRPTCPLSF
jgi:hypothetical protein